MHRTMFKAKIHRATVTEANLNYMGSITLDRDLMVAADILPGEQVQVVDVNNGARLVTYAIPGPAASGTVCLNGAAARLVQPGDCVIIISYALVDQSELVGFQPRVVHVDGQNRITAVLQGWEQAFCSGE